MKTIIKSLHFNHNGLIPAIIQDEKTGKVLTLCYMNKEALEKTLEEGKVYVFRRSKGALMLKGRTSGHTQIVKSVFVDCSDNSLLIKVKQNTAACHAGYFTCYYRQVQEKGALKVVENIIFDPDKIYKKG